MEDKVVEEVRAAREAYAALFDFDLGAICDDLVKKQVAGGAPTVSFRRRRPRRTAPGPEARAHRPRV